MIPHPTDTLTHPALALLLALIPMTFSVAGMILCVSTVSWIPVFNEVLLFNSTYNNSDNKNVQSKAIKFD